MQHAYKAASLLEAITWQSRSTSALVFLLAASLQIPASLGARERVHTKAMQFFATFRMEDDVLVSAIGTLGPREFFSSLHSADSPNGTVYTNDGGQVQFFPERITITVRILGPVAPGGRSILPGKLDYDLMRGLQFQAQWKRGVKLRPVREFRFLSTTESSFADLGNFGHPFNGWTYEMVVEEAQVPITDHLVLNILSPENKRIARISAYL